MTSHETLITNARGVRLYYEPDEYEDLPEQSRIRRPDRIESFRLANDLIKMNLERFCRRIGQVPARFLIVDCARTDTLASFEAVLRKHKLRTLKQLKLGQRTLLSQWCTAVGLFTGNVHSNADTDRQLLLLCGDIESNPGPGRRLAIVRPHHQLNIVRPVASNAKGKQPLSNPPVTPPSTVVTCRGDGAGTSASAFLTAPSAPCKWEVIDLAQAPIVPLPADEPEWPGHADCVTETCSHRFVGTRIEWQQHILSHVQVARPRKSAMPKPRVGFSAVRVGLDSKISIPEVPIEDGLPVSPSWAFGMSKGGLELGVVAVKETVVGEIEVELKDGAYAVKHSAIVDEDIDHRPSTLKHMDLLKRRARLQRVTVTRYALPWVYWFLVPLAWTLVSVLVTLIAYHDPVPHLVGLLSSIGVPSWPPVLQVVFALTMYPTWCPWYAWLLSVITGALATYLKPRSIMSWYSSRVLFSSPATNAAIATEDVDLCYTHLVANASKYVLRAASLPFDACTYTRVRFDAQEVMELILGIGEYSGTAWRKAGFQLTGHWSGPRAVPLA